MNAKRVATYGFGAACVFWNLTASAINSMKIDEYSDASGKITVAIFERVAATAQGQFRSFSIDVSSDYLAVGGGVEGAFLPYGHMITESYPHVTLIERFKYWLVSTKDHIYPHATQIKGYAIGLKLQGLTPSQLAGHLWLGYSSSNDSHRPVSAAGVPSGYLLISGGATLRPGHNSSSVGMLPHAFYPVAHTWTARAKDHEYRAVGISTAYSIGLKEDIPGIGRIALVTAAAESRQKQHHDITTYLPAGAALVGCGAYAEYSDDDSVFNEPSSLSDFPMRCWH